MKAVEIDPNRDRIMTILVDQAVDHVEEEKTKRERAGRVTAEQHISRLNELDQLHDAAMQKYGEATQRAMAALAPGGKPEEALSHLQEASTHLARAAEIRGVRKQLNEHHEKGEHGKAEEVHRAAMKRFSEAG